jgi:hypothetical protein
MELQDFDRCTWEADFETLTFYDRKDHDPYSIIEFERESDARFLWESAVMVLIRNKVKSFEFKLS